MGNSMVMSENLEVAVSVILFDGGTACSGTLQSTGTSLILAFFQVGINRYLALVVFLLANYVR